MEKYTDRILSLETEYALICNNSSNIVFDRDNLISKIETSVSKNHKGTKCNSLKFIANKQNPIHKFIIPFEGFFIDNGSRIYCDTGHFEWANPETNRPKDAIAYEKAAESNLRAAVKEVNTELQNSNSNTLVHLIKNNIDYSDNISYGCHENYSLCRFDKYGQDILKRLEDDLVPFLITRQIFCGSGRIGTRIAHPDDQHAFQLSQRADFIEKLISSNTRTERGILTNKDETLADDSKLHRLHLILGDSNISEIANFLKVGVTSLILDILEQDLIHAQWAVRNPIQALRETSRDWASAQISLKKGGRSTALDIQKEYLRLAILATNKLPNKHYKRQIIAHWSQTLKNIENKYPDTNLDWVIKHNIYSKILSTYQTDWQELGNWHYIIEKTKNAPRNPPNVSIAEWMEFQLGSLRFKELNDYVQSHGLNWQTYSIHRDILNKLRELDIHYHNITIAQNWRGNLSADIKDNSNFTLDSREIVHAQYNPPKNTRALQRWRILKLCESHQINAEAYWDKIYFPDTGNTLQLPDPFETKGLSLKSIREAFSGTVLN